MAITKAHIKIQEEKALLRARASNLHEQTKEQFKKVPDVVLKGSHQTAVKWKEMLADFEQWLIAGPKAASQEDLTNLCIYRSHVLDKLCGRKPLL